MKIAMIGAGGIGAYYAARLMNSGIDVVLTARGEHLAALQSQGLKVVHPDFSFFSDNVNAVDTSQLPEVGESGEFDLIIIATKSATTVDIMTQLNDWLATSKVPVLSIQNGVRNEETIAKYVGRERTIGGLAVKIGGHIVAPGVIEATGIARIEFGAWPNADANPVLQKQLVTIIDCFLAADIPATLENDISAALWRKLIINNAMNPLSALTYLDTKQITSHPVLTQTVYSMMQETARAAQFEGIAISDGDVDRMYKLICEFDAIKTSMLVDREKGRTMEIEDICGPVIDNCRRAESPAITTELIRSLLEANAVATPS